MTSGGAFSPSAARALARRPAVVRLTPILVPWSLSVLAQTG